MVKKDFRASIDSSLKGQVDADNDRFSKANSILSTLDTSAKQLRDKSSASSRTLVVRHTFSMSESDYAVIEALRRAAAAAPNGQILSASDICRIGINAIRGYSGKEVIAAVEMVERLKPGKKTKIDSAI